MKIECTKKEWSIISGVLMSEYCLSTSYNSGTFKAKAVYDDEEVLTICGKFIESEKCE